MDELILSADAINAGGGIADEIDRLRSVMFTVFVPKNDETPTFSAETFLGGAGEVNYACERKVRSIFQQMTALNTAVRSILFDPRLMRNRTYNGKRYQFANGKMKETAKFALLRRFGWTVTDRSEGGKVIIELCPPEKESGIFLEG